MGEGKQGKVDGQCLGWGGAFLKRVFMVGFIEKVAFEQSLKGGEGAICISGRRVASAEGTVCTVALRQEDVLGRREQ